MLATRRQRFKMISVRNLLHRWVPVSLAVFVLLLVLPSSVSPFGFDSANSCNPNGGTAKQSRRGRAQMMAAIPCDLTQQVYCHLPGAAYPWHAVRRFVHENQGLMKRMYGDVKHISVLRDELLGNEIDNADVAMAAERYSREGNRRSAKFLKNRRPGDEDYMGAGRPTNEAPHFRPVTTTTKTTTTTTEATPTDSLEKNESSLLRNEPGNEHDNGHISDSQSEHKNVFEGEHENVFENEQEKESQNKTKNESASEPKIESWKGPQNATLEETQNAHEPTEDIEDLAANSVYELIPPLAAHLSGDNIQIIASPQLPAGGLNATTTTTTTTKKVEPSPTQLTFTTTTSRTTTTTTTTTTTPSATPTEPTISSSHTTAASSSSSSAATTSSPASPFRRRQRPSMTYKQHHNLLQQQHQQHYQQQQQQQQQSQMLHLKISSTILRDSPATRIKLNESERIAVKGGGGVGAASLSSPGSTAATSTTASTTSTSTTTTQLSMNKRKPIKSEAGTVVAATAPTAFKGDHRFRKPAPTQSATPSTTAGTTSTTTKPVLKEGQLFQDTMKQEVVAAPAIPVTNMRGVNACPVKEEVVAPFWANNTRGEVLALLNLYPFEQYVHWEKCTHEHKQMYCRDGCRCEQQYRLHRLLAYDPHNECRGIFSDWFRFPSCCICKCYNIPMEFRATSRSPRSDQSGLYDSHQEGEQAAEAPPPRHPIETAEAEVKRAIYEHATEDWYRRRDDWHEEEVEEEDVEADPMVADGADEFGELF